MRSIRHLRVELSLEFRYALDYSDRPLRLHVNGSVVVDSLSFPATRSWTTWGTVSTEATLRAGTNTVRATAIGASGPNMDRLRVSN